MLAVCGPSRHLGAREDTQTVSRSSSITSAAWEGCAASNAVCVRAFPGAVAKSLGRARSHPDHPAGAATKDNAKHLACPWRVASWCIGRARWSLACQQAAGRCFLLHYISYTAFNLPVQITTCRAPPCSHRCLWFTCRCILQLVLWARSCWSGASYDQGPSSSRLPCL